jgi:CheY-like chemotaxis protein
MKKKVLLVDDDIDDIDFLREAFSEIDENIECQHALNGQEAVLLLQTADLTMPDIILLDINMPVMNGWEFLKWIKAVPNLKDIPVIVYSTSSREQDRALAGALGARQFISKPENYRVLKDILRGLLTRIAAGFEGVVKAVAAVAGADGHKMLSRSLVYSTPVYLLHDFERFSCKWLNRYPCLRP